MKNENNKEKRSRLTKSVVSSSFILLTFLFLINFISALPDNSDEVIYSHKQNTNFEYSFVSSTATGCNLTSGNTPSGIVTINQAATNSGKTFSISLLSGNFSSSGNYCYNLVCGNGTYVETGNVCIRVTPTGFSGTLGFYFVILAIITGIFILGYAMENNHIMTFGSISVLFFGFFIIKFGIDVIKDVETTWAIGIIVWAIGIICIFKSMEEQLKVWDKS